MKGDLRESIKVGDIIKHDYESRPELCWEDEILSDVIEVSADSVKVFTHSAYNSFEVKREDILAVYEVKETRK